MPTIDLIPTHDDSGGIRTEGGLLEYHFSTIEDLETRLSQAHIDSGRYEPELHELRRGSLTRIAVSRIQSRSFCM
jgi:hypothetical protein